MVKTPTYHHPDFASTGGHYGQSAYSTSRSPSGNFREFHERESSSRMRCTLGNTKISRSHDSAVDTHCLYLPIHLNTQQRTLGSSPKQFNLTAELCLGEFVVVFMHRESILSLGPTSKPQLKNLLTLYLTKNHRFLSRCFAKHKSCINSHRRRFWVRRELTKEQKHSNQHISYTQKVKPCVLTQYLSPYHQMKTKSTST